MTLFRALPARHLSTFFGQHRLTGLWQGRNRHHQVYIDAAENKNHWDINKKGLSFITTRRVQELFLHRIVRSTRSENVREDQDSDA